MTIQTQMSEMDEIFGKIIRKAIYYYVKKKGDPYNICYPTALEVLDGLVDRADYASNMCADYAQQIINLVRSNLIIYTYPNGLVKAVLEDDVIFEEYVYPIDLFELRLKIAQMKEKESEGFKIYTF